jgi:ElaB/YqjD/DUF883 family membrane-anchored ribosome-binding protein
VDNELEVIRDEMELTRANLADKLGALENQVRETVSDATDAVSSTVEGVKDVVSTVSETVESVTETFNVSKQVEQNPWLALGAAVATGFVAAQLFGGSSQPAPAPAPSPEPPRPPEPEHRDRAQPAAQQQQEAGSFLPSLESMLPEMRGVMNTMVASVGGLAVGSLMGVIRDLAITELPSEWKDEVTNFVNKVTTQLGGKTLSSDQTGQLLESLGLGGKSEACQHQDGQRQGGQHREGQRAEGAPYDPNRQPGEQPAGNGLGGQRGVRTQATTRQG